MAIKINETPLSSSVSSIIPHNGTLADSDFAPITRPTRKANILLFGEEKTGKTSFCTRYAPAPVMILSFDGRSDDAAYEAQEAGRDVRVANLLMPERAMDVDETKREAQSILDRAVRNAEIAIMEARNGNVRTLLIDGVTEFAEICKLALDGTIKKVKEHSHGEDKDFANRQIWRLANLARKSKSVHIVFTARCTEIWKDQKPTGFFKAQCPKAAKAAVDFMAQIKLKTVFGVEKPEVEMVMGPGINMEELGEVYDASKWDKLGGPFIYACCMNYKDSIPDDWK